MPRYTSVSEVLASYPDRFLPERAAGVDGVVQLCLSGAEGADYHLVIREQTLAVEAGRHASPTVVVTTSAAEWVRMNNGETNPMAMMMMGKLKIGGSLPMATKFQTLFRTP